jgi:hypothetical protein
MARQGSPYDRNTRFILKSQQNEILRMIEEVGLDPREFKWEEQASEREEGLWVSRLEHTPSGGFYLFDFQDNQHFGHFGPGEQAADGSQFSGVWDPYQRASVRDWLGFLKRELEAPDLWARLGASLRDVADVETVPDTIFLRDEADRVVGEIRELRGRLENRFDLTDRDLLLVGQRLTLLESSVRGQTKQAWLMMALGVLVSLVLAVPSFQAQLDVFVNHFKVLFDSVFSRPPTIPPSNVA